MYLPKRTVFICCSLFWAVTICAQEAPVTDTIVVPDSAGTFQQYVHDSVVEYDNFEDEVYTHASPLNNLMHDTISLREVPAQLTEKLKRRKEFEYANDPAYWSRPAEVSEEIRTGWLQKLFNFLGRPAVRNFVMLMLIILGIYIVIRVIIVNKLYIFKAPVKNQHLKTGSEEAALMEEDLDEKVRQAIADGNHRSAVRFMYLKTLKLLDKKGWITYHPQSTNYAYRNQVNNYAKGKDFGFLISVYEYVWYGDFKLSTDQFNTVYHNFTHFQSSLKV